MLEALSTAAIKNAIRGGNQAAKEWPRTEIKKVKGRGYRNSEGDAMSGKESGRFPLLHCDDGQGQQIFSGRKGGGLWSEKGKA